MAIEVHVEITHTHNNFIECSTGTGILLGGNGAGPTEGVLRTIGWLPKPVLGLLSLLHPFDS